MADSTHGANFTAVHLGWLAQLDQYTYKHPALPRETDGKVFLNQLLGMTSSEISLNKLPPLGLPCRSTIHTASTKRFISS